MRPLDFVSATDPSATRKLHQLQERMDAFYNGENQSTYFISAHSRNEIWPEDSLHGDIRRLVHPGWTVADIGCGTGHAWPNLKQEGVLYVGVDGSRKIIEEDIREYGHGPTFSYASIYSTGLQGDGFNLTMALYVLEHAVWPHLLLKEMVRITKVGGHVVVLAPEYRRFGRMPSLWYGRGENLRAKVRAGHWADGARHLWLRTVYYPFRIRHGSPFAGAPFLINMAPSCLQQPWDTDRDAVYMVDRGEVLATLEGLGCEDCTRVVFPRWSKTGVLSRTICAIAVRKVRNNE